MLQCLCGKSLKKNKNPSGKLMTIMPVYSVPLSRSLCVRESVTRWRARLCVIVCCNDDRSAITFMQQVDHAEALGGVAGKGRGATYSVQPLYQHQARA